MLIVISSVATVLVAVWLLLLMRAKPEDYAQAAQARLIDNAIAARKLKAAIKKRREKLSQYQGALQSILTALTVAPLVKKTKKLEREAAALQNAAEKEADMLLIPGYVLQREFDAIGKSGFRKKIYTNAFELYGKKHAQCKTSQMLAKMLSYPIIGTATALMLGVILIGAGQETAGLGIIGAGTVLILVLVYGIYDELTDTVKKRRKLICRQFPNVISKLALLVTSGMIMDRAWKETAYSQDTELYIEMQRTSEELDNLVSPEAAYAGFINRCNTKETAKLASAIMQNRSKGNAEIGRLLKDMAREVWQERRHTAKRDAEKANSKLMIPTMLLFLAILVMLMVPIAMNFSGI